MSTSRPGLPNATPSGTATSTTSSSTADFDTGCFEGGDLVVGDRRPIDLGFVLAVDRRVGPIADRCELVGDRRVDGRVVALVVGKVDAHRREELVVGDVLLFGGHDAARDVELGLLVEVVGKQLDDAVVLTEEQRLHGGEADVLVDSNIAGDHRGGRIGEEATHQVDLGSLGAGTGRRRRQIAVDVEQRGVVVGGVAVDRAVAQPVEAFVGAAVDSPGIDVGADRVDLLAGRVVPRAVGDGSAAHRDPAEVVGELLERVGGVERDREVLLAGRRAARSCGR